MTYKLFITILARLGVLFLLLCSNLVLRQQSVVNMEKQKCLTSRKKEKITLEIDRKLKICNKFSILLTYMIQLYGKIVCAEE